MRRLREVTTLQTEWTPVTLGTDAMERLNGLGMAVMVPARVPPGFTLESLDAEGTFYELRFRGDGDSVIHVHGAGEGIGDVFPGVERHAYHHPQLGAGEIEWYVAQSDEPLEFSSPWMHGGAEWPVYGVCGRGLSPAEAVRLTESLVSLDSMRMPGA